jgi:uncharacterized protein (TIGR03503 family)
MGWYRVSLFTFVSCLLLLSASLSAADKNTASKADVRLLIDISGSMKKNDPKNLRVPALQLVTNLLPKDSEAGVWAFGRYVNMMVPLSKVDAKWQVNATNTAKKINSAGLFTNIGSVLEKASYGWTTPDLNEKRSMVLLTDGMVDISKDPSINAAERERILTKVLPKLRQAGVAIHTIALSQNADHELLQELSKQTDGWYESVNNAEELQKVFLKIFEQATERDSLPISDNKFTVDASIEEMTVLIFRQQDSQPAKLIAPSGAEMDKSTSSSQLRWFNTEGYDLVTLQNPETGDWKIDADVDPDNRVMVVSKLGLNVVPVPNNLLAGEAINYELKLVEEGEVISNADFLKLVDARLEQEKAGQTSRMAMFYDRSESIFKQSFYTDSFQGELKLKLIVKSPTFERIRTHAINIYGSPLVVDVEPSSDNIVPHQLHFSVRQDIVQKDSLKVTATIAMPDGKKLFVGLEDLDKPLDIQASLAGGDYSVEFKISGLSILGREFNVTPAATQFSSISTLIEETPKQPEPEIEAPKPEQPASEEEQPEPEVQQEVVEQKPKVEEPIAESEEDADAEMEGEAEPTNWLYWGLGANLILAIVGFFIWRLIKKRNAKGVSELADELGIDDDEDDDSEDEPSKQPNNDENSNDDDKKE